MRPVSAFFRQISGWRLTASRPETLGLRGQIRAPAVPSSDRRHARAGRLQAVRPAGERCHWLVVSNVSAKQRFACRGLPVRPFPSGGRPRQIPRLRASAGTISRWSCDGCCFRRIPVRLDSALSSMDWADSSSRALTVYGWCVASGFGRQIFKRAGFPGQQTLERRFAARALGFGINQFAVLNPEFGHERAAGDAQHGGTAGKTFHLDDVHEAFALDAAKAGRPLSRPRKRFKAVEEQF